MGHHPHPVADAGIPTDRAVVLVHGSEGASSGQLLKPVDGPGWLSDVANGVTPTRAPGHAEGAAAAAEDGTLFREYVWLSTDDHVRSEWSRMLDGLHSSWKSTLLRLPRLGEIALENTDDPATAEARDAVTNLSRAFRHFAFGLMLPFFYFKVLLLLTLGGVARRGGFELTSAELLPLEAAWPALALTLVLYLGVGGLLKGTVHFLHRDADGGDLPHNPKGEAWNHGLLIGLFFFPPALFLVALARLGGLTEPVPVMSWISALDGVGQLAYAPAALTFLAIVAACVYYRLRSLTADAQGPSVWGTPLISVALTWMVLDYLLFTALAALALLYQGYFGHVLVPADKLLAGGLVFQATLLGLAMLGLAYVGLRATGRESGYSNRRRDRACDLVILLAVLWLPLYLALRSSGAPGAELLVGEGAFLRLSILVLVMFIAFVLLVTAGREVILGLRDMVDYLDYRPARDRRDGTVASVAVGDLNALIDELAAAGHSRILLLAEGTGSVIAYDALRTRAARDDLRLELVTVNSVLSTLYARWMPDAMYGPPLASPASVSSWHDVWDEDDLLGGPVAGEVDAQQSLGWEGRGSFGDPRLSVYLRQLLRAELEAFNVPSEPVGAAS